MANNKDKHSENAPGAWYVDKTCIDCGMCAEYAPAVFRLASDGTQMVVHHQPASAGEQRSALESMSGCPVDAIGNDG